MTRTLVPAAVVAATLASGLPAAAQAKSGWKLPAIAGNGGVANVSTATRCGRSPFGTWRFTNRTEKGAVHYSVRLTQDGRARRATRVRFSGRLPARLRRETRTLLRTARYRYVGGNVPRVQSVLPSGKVQAQRLFNPVRVRC